MRVQSRRRRAGNAMKPRRRNGWRPKPELKRWWRLLLSQVQKPEIDGFSADTSLEVLKVPSFHRFLCLPEQHTVGFSQSSLIHLVGPLDCTLHNYAHGGQSLSLPFPPLHVIITFLEVSEPICFLFCWIDVALNLFLMSNGNLHISSWPNVLTSISIYLISQMLSDVNLLLAVVVNRYWSEFYHSDPSTYTYFTSHVT